MFSYAYLPFGDSILKCPCYGLDVCSRLDSSIGASSPNMTIFGHKAFMDVKLNEGPSMGR